VGKKYTEKKDGTKITKTGVGDQRVGLTPQIRRKKKKKKNKPKCGSGSNRHRKGGGGVGAKETEGIANQRSLRSLREYRHERGKNIKQGVG